VLWVDRYGNAQLNLEPEEIEEMGDHVRLRFNDEVRTAKVVTTFAEVGPNEIGLIVDSYGLVSIVVDQQSAASQLGLGPSTGVVLSPFTDDQEMGDHETGDLGITTEVTLSAKGRKEI
jgi:S-adenosylmethionine hydrolase